MESAWQADADRSQRFSRVLVIGVSHDANVRCDFESFMTSQLRTTIDAKSSCLLSKTTEPLTRELVERMIGDYQPDAVLATSLVQSAVSSVDGGGRDTRGGAYYKATDIGYATPYYYGGYSAYGIPVVYGEFQVAQPVTTIDGAVKIDTMLYATRDASLVYEIKTSARDLTSRDNALATLTAPIAERLRRDGLID